jgi:hypothetical protein
MNISTDFPSNKVKSGAKWIRKTTAKNISFTHSLMEPSPSREAANCAATRELPSIL